RNSWFPAAIVLVCACSRHPHLYLLFAGRSSFWQEWLPAKEKRTELPLKAERARGLRTRPLRMRSRAQSPPVGSSMAHRLFSQMQRTRQVSTSSTTDPAPVKRQLSLKRLDQA